MSKTMTWGMTCLPAFKDLKVFVLPGPGYAQIVSLFCQAGAKRAPSVQEAGLVVFLGGSDVNPKLYNENPVEEVVSWDSTRDARETSVFEVCKKNGIPMFGICRGAQFLHVMNGGSLWQHVDGHCNGNHLIYDVDEDLLVRSSSTHHQMMKYNDSMTLLAVTDEPVASFVKNEEEQLDVADAAVIEVEACFYDATKCLCVQGHPEYGPREFTSWSFHKLHELMHCNWMPDSPSEVLKALA